MYHEYDKEVDGIYIWFVKDIEKCKEEYKSEIWPVELKDEIGFIFNKKGKLMGIEILPASKYFDLKDFDKCDKSKSSDKIE